MEEALSICLHSLLNMSTIFVFSHRFLFCKPQKLLYKKIKEISNLEPSTFLIIANFYCCFHLIKAWEQNWFKLYLDIHKTENTNSLINFQLYRVKKGVNEVSLKWPPFQKKTHFSKEMTWKNSLATFQPYKLRERKKTLLLKVI